MSNPISLEANKEKEEVSVRLTSPSPDPTVASGTPQTHHYQHEQNQPMFPHHNFLYNSFGMNQFNGPFPSTELPYGSGYNFQNHRMYAPVPPFETQSVRTAKVSVSKRKASKPSASQSSNPPRRLWTPAEDIALTKAYLYVSVDSITGKDQTSDKMWNRVLVAWRDFMGTYDETRKANGLSCRWGLIQAAVTKFHAAYEALERTPRSGASIDVVKREALRVYRETGDGSSFKYEHCWEILKENPKWCSLQLTKTGNSKKEKKIGEGSVDTPAASSQLDGVTGVDKENPDAEQSLPRPPGRKASKDKVQKLNEQKNMAAILSSFQSTIEKQHLLNQQELELKKEKDRKDQEMMEQMMKKELELKEKSQQMKEDAQRKKDKLGKRKESERIMTTDLTALQPAVRKIYEQMQAKIIKEWEEEGLLGDD